MRLSILWKNIISMLMKISKYKDDTEGLTNIDEVLEVLRVHWKIHF